MTKEEDRRLVKRCLAGEEQAWRELSAFLAPVAAKAVRRVFRRQGEGGAPAEWEEEIRAAVLARLWEEDCRRLRSFQWECSLATFLYVMAARLAGNRLRQERRERRKRRILGETLWNRQQEALPSDRLVGGEEADRLRDSLSQLTPEERELLWDAYVHGRTYEQLAAMKSIPSGTVASRLSSIRKKLLSFLRGTLSILLL